MNIITRRTLLFYIAKYPLATNSLLIWYKDFSNSSFKNFNELKAVYSNASIIANNRVIFNIKGNSFRLIISIDFKRQAAYVIWFGTHLEYDKIDAATVAYTKA
jgi:mRNA interferase HigB